MSTSDWLQRWRQIARAREATAVMALASGHEIYVVVPDWREWPVPPWYTVKLREWELKTPRQRAATLREMVKRFKRWGVKPPYFTDDPLH